MPSKILAPLSSRVPLRLSVLVATCTALVVWSPPPVRALPVDVQPIYQFSPQDDLGFPRCTLAAGPDGAFYGVAVGYNEAGGIYKVTPGGAYTILHVFKGRDGAKPVASLRLGSDGAFYGTTTGGGAHDLGTIFRCTVAGELTTLHDFSATERGDDESNRLVQGPDGAFYGSNRGGGTRDLGLAYRVTPAGEFSVLHEFGVSGEGTPNGLTLGPDGAFYGTLRSGTGTAVGGQVFRLTTAGAYSLVYGFGSFSGTGTTTGLSPQGDLTLGSDGLLYGVNSNGGSGRRGTIYKVSTGGSLTVLYSLPSNGGRFLSHSGALVEASDGFFYGLTDYAGANGVAPLFGGGTAFKISRTGAFTTLHDFTPLGADGDRPYGSLVQGADGAFYGTTSRGGDAFGAGTLFRMSGDGAITPLHVFRRSNADGTDPGGFGDRLCPGADGALYGVTFRGGTDGQGTLFRVTTGGAQTTLHSFGAAEGGNVADPFIASSLIQGPDGSFYGTSVYNNAGHDGTVFKVSPAGESTILHAFGGNDVDGSAPAPGLTRGPDGAFYGTTESGGAIGGGTVFRITADGAYKTVHDFDLNEPDSSVYAVSDPSARLLLASDGAFYGVTRSGGGTADHPGGGGGIFRITPDGTYTVLHKFAFDAPAAHADSGDGVAAPLAEGPDGALYGTTFFNGAEDVGTVFRLTKDGVFSTIHSFTSAGGSCYSGLTLADDGWLYGRTVPAATFTVPSTALSDTVFRITPTGTYETLYTFSRPFGGINAEGQGPDKAFIPGADGNLYGEEIGGTANGHGSIVRMIYGVPVISSALTAAAPQGAPFTYQIVANRTATGYAAAGLPSGLSVDPVTGVISGTPTAQGNFQVTLSATNVLGTGSATLSLSNLPVVTLTLMTSPVVTGTGEVGTFEMRLSEPLDHDLFVTVAIKGSAVNGTDYALRTTRKRVRAGRVRKIIHIYPQGDLRGADKRTVKIVVLAGEGYQVGDPAIAKVKILDHP